MTTSQALGLAAQHHNAGRLSEAEHIYRQILQKEPNHPDAIHMLGVLAYQVGKHELAVELIAGVLAVHPDLAEAHCNMGNALRELGRLDEAITSYHKALTIRPDFADAHNNVGVAFQTLGEFEKAVECHRKVIEFEPHRAEGHNNLGTTLHEIGATEEAIASYRKALALLPDYCEALNNLGVALQATNNLEEALVSCQDAVKIRPEYPEAHYNVGNILKDLDRMEEALASYQHALELKPNYTEALFNKGNSLRELGKLDEALACYETALTLNPDYAEVHTNLALVLLLQGVWKRGWKEFKWRIKDKREKFRTLLPIEMWTGYGLKDENIVVYAEQGVGDEIMFSSCIPDLLEESPRRLFLECDPRLEALFARSFPDVHVHGKERDLDLSWAHGHGPLDYSLPIGSLPKFFRNRVEDFPSRDSFLVPNPTLAGKWKRRLSDLGEGAKIGISWRGGQTATSIPLPSWEPLLSMNAFP